MARYKFYTTPGPRVICVSSYAGRKVRGVAICSESDEYDMEKGQALAKARVDVEIARRRVKHAESKYYEALDACDSADAQRNTMRKYVNESYCILEDAEEHLDYLLSKM